MPSRFGSQGLTLILEPTAFIKRQSVRLAGDRERLARYSLRQFRTVPAIAAARLWRHLRPDLFGAGNIGKLINGVTTTEPGGLWFNGFASSPLLKFDFGTPRVIDAFRWWQGNNSNHGSWKWQGSHDDTSYADIGGTFTLDGPIGGGGKEHTAARREHHGLSLLPAGSGQRVHQRRA